MIDIKFSVTVPSYKGLYLEKCIESVLAQTYKKFELIIINDASPENLDIIVKKYNDSRIKYYANENNCGAINVVDNWNKCLDYATGDYILCMGDDDKLLPNCLEEYCKLIEKYPSLHVYQGWTEIIDENDNFYDMIEALPQWESVLSLIWHNWHGRGQYIGNILFYTKVLRENGGFYKLPMAMSSDEISTYIAALNGGIANTQIPVFQYRKSCYSITNNGNAKALMNAIDQEETWFKNFLTKQATNDIDRIYWNYLIKELPHHIKKKRKAVIFFNTRDKSIVLFLKWCINYRKYNIKLIDILAIIYKRHKTKKFYNS